MRRWIVGAAAAVVALSLPVTAARSADLPGGGLPLASANQGAVAPNASLAQLEQIAGQSNLVLAFSTYFGSDGLSDNVNAVAVDNDNNVYVTGSVDAPGGLPITQGAYQTAFGGGSDAFVAKIDPAGQLVYATYFGGSGGEGAEEIDVGPDGSAYVIGVTGSSDLPTTPGAFQTVLRGDVENCDTHCPHDAFVARLSSDGSDLLYSTFLGGDHDEMGGAIKVDETGDAYVVGMTSSPDFPVTPGAFDENYNEPTCFEPLCDVDGFVARLSADGTDLGFSTFFGGTSNDSPQDLDMDAAGNLYVAGGAFSTDLPRQRGRTSRRRTVTATSISAGLLLRSLPI